MGWKDHYVMQGCATLGDRLWHYTSNADRTDPSALTEYSWGTGQEMARHNEPQESGLDLLGYLGTGGHGDCQGRRDQGLVRNRPWEPGT
jgi:hypothetical protein